jgi:hypothetical protein
MNEDENQVAGDAESSDTGALGESTETQGEQASSSDDGTTGAEEPTVADLQKQIDEMKASHEERESKWGEEYRAGQSERDQLRQRLEPYERQARMAQEEVDRQNEQFHDLAAKIGYPAAIARLTAQQQDIVAAQMTKEQIINDARQKFLDAGKMPSDFDKFYNSRQWGSKEAFFHDVDLHLKAEHVTNVTAQSKEALAREADKDARRKLANTQPKGGGEPSLGGKSADRGTQILDGMANAARRQNAASSEL